MQHLDISVDVLQHDIQNLSLASDMLASLKEKFGEQGCAAR